jgi:hypothetical protein
VVIGWRWTLSIFRERFFSAASGKARRSSFEAERIEDVELIVFRRAESAAWICLSVNCTMIDCVLQSVVIGIIDTVLTLTN